MVATSYSPHVLSWQFSDSRSQQQGERKYGIISLCIPSFLLTCQICLVEQSYWLSLQSIKLSGGTWYTLYNLLTLLENHILCAAALTQMPARQKGWNVRTPTNMWLTELHTMISLWRKCVKLFDHHFSFVAAKIALKWLISFLHFKWNRITVLTCCHGTPSNCNILCKGFVRFASNLIPPIPENSDRFWNIRPASLPHNYRDKGTVRSHRSSDKNIETEKYLLRAQADLQSLTFSDQYWDCWSRRGGVSNIK